MKLGIAAAVPIVIKPCNRVRFTWWDTKPLTPEFLENYNLIETEGNEETYEIKTDVLIKNSKSFITEFYELVEDDFCMKTGLTLDTIPIAESVEDFIELFSRKNRNTVPFISRAEDFDTVGCKCNVYWLFHSGSFLVTLAENKTLMHFESVLTKSMKNPLAQVIKIGVFGAY